MTPAVVTAYVALGANLGDPVATVHAALDALSRLPGVHCQAVSSLYRTAPVGLRQQPDFINAVAALTILDTARLTPHALLAELFAIEARFGRQRSIPDAARTLDLDLLLYDGQTCQDATLTLPHPRMHQRAFVLVPLLEIAADSHIPGHGRVAGLLPACQDQAIEKLAPIT